ncbi:MAG: SNF2-related protein [Acidithiobacillus ferrivorans]
MRLAEAGFGACLADDMGLGKTLQAIAVLLARASSGPALVVAPTSVCGNWRAELERFAPSLHVMVYGAGDRSTILETAGPRDVVIVSYTLLQQAQTQFAARRTPLVQRGRGRGTGHQERHNQTLPGSL